MAIAMHSQLTQLRFIDKR